MSVQQSQARPEPVRHRPGLTATSSSDVNAWRSLVKSLPYVPFPRNRLHAEDAQDSLLVMCCEALTAVENRALCPKEIAEICMDRGWQCRCAKLSISAGFSIVFGLQISIVSTPIFLRFAFYSLLHLFLAPFYVLDPLYPSGNLRSPSYLSCNLCFSPMVPSGGPYFFLARFRRQPMNH
jgi:hypothetical protein